MLVWLLTEHLSKISNFNEITLNRHTLKNFQQYLSKLKMGQVIIPYHI